MEKEITVGEPKVTSSSDIGLTTVSSNASTISQSNFNSNSDSSHVDTPSSSFLRYSDTLKNESSLSSLQNHRVSHTTQATANSPLSQSFLENVQPSTITPQDYLSLFEQAVLENQPTLISIKNKPISIAFIHSLTFSITHLTLSNNYLSDHLVSLLLPKLLSLTYLTLSQNKLQPHRSIQLLHTLYFSKLIHLNLSSCGLEDELMLTLVIFLSSNRQLQGLWIGYNRFTDFKPLVKEVLNNDIELLSVVGNPGKKGISELKKAMKERQFFS